MRERFICSFDATAELAEAIDEHSTRLRQATRWTRASRSAAIRDLIARGLRAVEADESRVT